MDVSESESGRKKELIDPQLWRACTGGTIHLPELGALVLYFPQGHLEHDAVSASSLTTSLDPAVFCWVVSVECLADEATDEVYARIGLKPATGGGGGDWSAAPISGDIDDCIKEEESLTFFAKTLTQSDANNGGGFSVPRYCAETYFPALNYAANPPVQTLHARDVHGELWQFRHVYRGTPRRHLLTTGWAGFVSRKRLIPGDSVVFLRNSAQDLCVGIRHSQNKTAAHVRTHAPPENSHSVAEAMSRAATRSPFHVTYYPRSTIFAFCVDARLVTRALQKHWTSGMRFKMPVETNDSSRTSWFMGTIAKVEESDPVHWPNSPWKMLQVIWDEPELLQGISRVSPWQIELVYPMQIPQFSPPRKKLQVLEQPLDLQLNGQIMGLTMAAVANNVLGQIGIIPSGMKGARHGGDDIGLSRPTKRIPRNLFPTSDYSGLIRPNVLTEQKLSTSRHEHLDYLMGWNSVDDPVALVNQNSPERTRSFMLFGEVIDPTQSEQPSRVNRSGSGSGNRSESESRSGSGNGNGSGINVSDGHAEEEDG